MSFCLDFIGVSWDRFKLHYTCSFFGPMKKRKMSHHTEIENKNLQIVSKMKTPSWYIQSFSLTLEIHEAKKNLFYYSSILLITGSKSSEELFCFSTYSRNLST